MQTYEGAFINCWIRSKNEDSAIRISKEYINKENWKIEFLEEKNIITQGFYNHDDEGIKYYNQAILDGECFVIHTWERKPS